MHIPEVAGDAMDAVADDVHIHMLVVNVVPGIWKPWLMMIIMAIWMVTVMVIIAMWRAVDRDKDMSAFAIFKCRHGMVMVSKIATLPMTFLFISCIVFVFAIIKIFFLWSIAFVFEAVPLIVMNYRCRPHCRITLWRMVGAAT